MVVPYQLFRSTPVRMNELDSYYWKYYNNKLSVFYLRTNLLTLKLILCGVLQNFSYMYVITLYFLSITYLTINSKVVFANRWRRYIFYASHSVISIVFGDSLRCFINKVKVCKTLCKYYLCWPYLQEWRLVYIKSFLWNILNLNFSITQIW